MDKRVLFGLVAGINIILAILLVSGNRVAAASSTDHGGRYLAVGINDGSSNYKAYLFVLDTEEKRLMLYDVQATKLRLSSVRYIQYDTVPKMFELANKPGGSPKDLKKLWDEERKKERKRNGSSD